MVEKTTSAEWFAQEIAADFTAFVGKIYPEFDDRLHVKNHTYNPVWPTYGFWDWGFVNALAYIEVQVDPSDNVYIWREHYEPWLQLEEHINILKNRQNPPGFALAGTYADSADQEAVATVNTKFAACIALDEAKANWRQGIEVVKRFLKPRDTGLLDPYDTPIMKPKLFVDPSCINTIKEFQNYKMKRQPTTGTDPQEKAEKKNDHAMDAIRYGLMHLFELGAKYHLSEIYGVPQRYSPTEQDGHPTKMVLASTGSRGHFTRNKEF
jgi:hypothetical protein